MRILFLSPRQPLPARSGAKLREFHFLRALGRRAEVSYLYFGDPGAEPLTVKDLPCCREVVCVPKPPAYGFTKMAMGILGRWPLPVLNYTSPEMTAVVERMMNTRDFDIVHPDSIHMVRYVMTATQRVNSLRAIYDWHNIESEAMQRYSETPGSRPRRWYAGLTAAKLRSVEGDVLKSAFGHVVCSGREKAQLQKEAPEARIAVVENGVDTGYFGGWGDWSGASRRIVFVGAMDYFPNSEAAVFFANRIWPRLRETTLKGAGGLELTIVGANPGPEVRALGELPGITVTGMVPDVRPYYQDALAAIVPLRTGGGTRLKILEAMAAGVPVVSTPLGAEGLPVVNGENALLVDSGDSEGWAERIGRLAKSPQLRRGLTEAGLQLVKTKYDWEIIGQKLLSTYEEWLDVSTSER